MLNRDSEIVICSRLVNCELWFCDMNSTLGSVVPLAMFYNKDFPSIHMIWYRRQHFLNKPMTVRAATWGQSWSCFKIYLCKKWLLWEFLDDAEQGSLWRQGTMLRTGLFQQRLLMQQWLGRSGLEVGLRKRSSVTAADRVCIKTSLHWKDLGRLPTLKTCTNLFNGWFTQQPD